MSFALIIGNVDCRTIGGGVVIASFESKLQFVSRLNSEQIEQLWRMYQAEPCGRARRREDVRRLVEHSDLIFAFCDLETGRLLAFARVLTDFVCKAVVFDVLVDRPRRDHRLRRMLLDAITAHPALLFVEHIELFCRDEMVPFYRNWGFAAELRKLRLVRRVQEPLAVETSMATKAS